MRLILGRGSGLFRGLTLAVLATLLLALPASVDAAKPPKPACADLIDNDADALIDLADPGCANKFDNDEYNAPPPPPPVACADGLDNDGDALIDLADPGCVDAADTDEYNEPPPPPPPPVAVKRYAVVLINFTNRDTGSFVCPTTSPCSLSGYLLANLMTETFGQPWSTAALYREMSYGKQDLAGTAFGPWTVPYDNLTCNTLGWKNSAREQALAQGVNLDTDFDEVALVWSYTTACQFGGRAGSFFNGFFTRYATSHEWGHGFSLSHAGMLVCVDGAGTPVTLSTSCTVNEYGDVFDVMGSGASGLKHFNGWEKADVGWLTNTQTITVSGRYTISPLEWQPQPAPQLLLIPRADGTVFTLEFRQPYGTVQSFRWAEGSYAVNGVQVRVATAMPGDHSGVQHYVRLLDGHPDTAETFDAPLTPGETLTDPLGGVSFTVVSVGPSGAVVDVVVG